MGEREAPLRLRPGERLGRYEIVAPIGSGGMGEVYRARDLELGREVAVKVLPEDVATEPEAELRFEREVRAAAALSHPNVLTIHDYGRCGETGYAVSELLEGEPLQSRIARGPMPWGKALGITRAVTEGLAALHSRGIVHCDLKPGNIFLTTDGQVKILDFGVARMQWSRLEGRDLTGAQDSETSMVLGTVGYMSPEQARGGRLDPRSDLFTLGSVMYEMLTGRRAFGGSNVVTTALAIMNDEPPPCADAGVEVPEEVEALVRACLHKSPRQRWQSARSLATALDAALAKDTRTVTRLTPAVRPRRTVVLRWAAVAAVVLTAVLAYSAFRLNGLHRPEPVELPDPLAIAVLPMIDLSADDRSYFADGMTEALIAELARIRALRVISRTSALQFRETTLRVPEIAAQLGVDMVVEGSVTCAGGRVRVIVQLIDGRTDEHVWARSFESDIADLLVVQRGIATAVAEETRITLTPDERDRLESAPKVDPEAHELYLKGQFELNQRTLASVERALALFSQAADRDPAFALPFVGLAEASMILPKLGAMPLSTGFERARAAAGHALEIDPSLAEAHTVLGIVRAEFDWDWAAAESDFRRALELNPGCTRAHERLAVLLAAEGRTEEALSRVRRARELDPMSPLLPAVAATVCYFGGRYDEALSHLARTFELAPGWGVARALKGLCFEQQGRLEEAVAELESAADALGVDRRSVVELAHTYALAGQTRKALEVIAFHEEHEELAASVPLARAFLLLAQGHNDEALEWLERAREDRNAWLYHVKVDPRLEPVRGTPGYDRLLRRMGLVPARAAAGSG